MKCFILLWATILCFGAPAFGQVTGTRADFLKIIDRPQVPLAPHVEELSATNGLVEFHFSFAADAKQRVRGLLLKNENAKDKRPVVIIMHGTGGRKEDELPLLRQLARKGFIAVAIDGRYHGERTVSGHGSAEYQNAIVRAWGGSGEHPLFYDTVWDICRLVDYLATRDDVDALRIGLTGISKGGIETYLTAAIDPRIAAAVPFIGVQSFDWELKNNDWQGRIATIQNGFDTIQKNEGVTNVTSATVQKFYDRIVPGIYSEFDGPKMLTLIAPRPLLVINGDHDPNCPLPGVELAVTAAQKAYAADNATNHFTVIIQKNTAHAVKPESERAMIDWFVKWLQP